MHKRQIIDLVALGQSPAVSGTFDHATGPKSCHRRSPTMRQKRTIQATIFDLFATYEIGRELKTMSQWLDEHRDLLGRVVRDLP
jgi:hypothetical protein